MDFAGEIAPNGHKPFTQDLLGTPLCPLFQQNTYQNATQFTETRPDTCTRHGRDGLSGDGERLARPGAFTQVHIATLGVTSKLRGTGKSGPMTRARMEPRSSGKMQSGGR